MLSIPPSSLAPIAFYPDGPPQVWNVFLPGIGDAMIEGTRPIGGDYSSFRVSVEPDPVSPTWLCFWDFSAAEVFAGIDTSDPPTHFEDTFISLGSLLVLPTFV